MRKAQEKNMSGKEEIGLCGTRAHLLGFEKELAGWGSTGDSDSTTKKVTETLRCCGGTAPWTHVC
jgi:hypothetical protein